MILVIDNYDSFVYNLVRYLEELGHEVVVQRNDQIQLSEIKQLGPSHIILSPGPCSPTEAGISNAVVSHYGPHIPLLGVCLGHQCIGQVFGAAIKRAIKPIHGKVTQINHNQRGIFTALPAALAVTRYHSLVVDSDQLPESLEVTAWSPAGEIMALAHRRFPMVGVQFHPEALLTEYGHEMLNNFLLGRYR